MLKMKTLYSFAFSIQPYTFLHPKINPNKGNVSGTKMNKTCNICKVARIENKTRNVKLPNIINNKNHLSF